MKNKITTLLILVLIMISGYALSTFNSQKSMHDFDQAFVTRVVDGDTIVIDTGEKVRLILVNAPESVHADASKNTALGKLASDFTRATLLNKRVYLETDVSDKDQYGRLLRYVYLEDGTFFNALLVKEGYAQMATYPPDIKHKDLILAAQRYAKKNNKGLWRYQESK